MSRFTKFVERTFRKRGDGQRKQHLSPAIPSNITSEDTTVTGSENAQQEQSGGGSPSATLADRQQPPAAQSLWDQAYNALAKENPDMVKQYDELLAKEEQMANSAPEPHRPGTRCDRSPRQTQLSTVIQYGLNRMEDNKTTLNIADHEISREYQMTKASKFLLWSRDWIGTAVMASPDAAIVWSTVCLSVPLLTDSITAFKAKRDGFVYVTSRLRYYVALEPLLHRLGQNGGVDEALITATNDHIVDLYQVILDVQLSSVLRFYRIRLKTYARDIVTLKDWEQIRIDIKTREDTVNDDLDRINQLAARQELERLNRTSEETHNFMESLLSVATQPMTVAKRQLSFQDDAKQYRLQEVQRNCLQVFWLTQNGKGAAYDWYKDRVELCIEGTCKWFLQHKKFREWLSQESGPLLVTADPWCGKSVLAKYLIDHELAQQLATICYFFFKDQEQNTIRQALCALLHQLFSQNSALIQHATELYNKRGAELIESETSLWAILRDAVCDPQAGPVMFVIDALDECHESQLSGLMRNLENMFRDQQLAKAKFKVLMTSRPYEQVVSQVYRSFQDDFPHLHIRGEEEFEAISQEINSVIHYRVEQLAHQHQLSDKVKTHLNNKLLAIDHHTYLWVYPVFDRLDKGFRKTENGIDAAIQKVTKTVNQAYDQILSRSQDDESIETVKKALNIILVARRPLTVSEMNIAMSLDGQGRGRSVYGLDLDQNEDFKTHLRTLCGLFVNVHHDKVYLLHQTARDFLIQSSTPITFWPDLQGHRSITIRHAHSVLAEICMFYLERLNSTDTESFRQEDHHGALLEYSVEHWVDHFREADFEKGSPMVDLASRLCTPDLTSHSLWASIISGRYKIRSKSSTNVLVASHLGLTAVTELLLSRGADIEARDSHGYSALMLAARSGHESATRLLLVMGADVEARDDTGTTALMVAVESGHEDITRLLLEHGAAVGAKKNDGTTALIYAAISGHEAVTRLLLQKGADVDARDDDGWTALIYAAESGHEAVGRLLLGNGADVEAKKNGSRTALTYAAGSGHEAVTRLLLEKGADVEARDDNGWTALRYAARSGHEDLTLLLLKTGANIEASDSDGTTALIYAARSGHETVTRLLLVMGAYVEARNDAGTTALMVAVESGHEDVTRLLLDHGAAVEASDEDGTTALMYAARSGHEAVTRLLLENGVDVGAKKNDGTTALMFAAESGHEAVTRLLLENGAAVKAKKKDGRTALIYAAICGHEAVTRLLLKNGANVRARDDDGMTALIYAAESGLEVITRLLLDYGAVVGASDNDGRTALIYAARYGHEAVTWLLLENDAAVGTSDDDDGEALIYAARFGHEAVTRLLLKNGADVGARDDNDMTAMLYAAESGHEAVTKLLLENGADVEARDDDGWTALIYAAKFGHEAVARLLLDNGADVEAKDKKGRTALRHAAEAITQLLLDHGAQAEAKDVEGLTV